MRRRRGVAARRRRRRGRRVGEPGGGHDRSRGSSDGVLEDDASVAQLLHHRGAAAFVFTHVLAAASIVEVCSLQYKVGSYTHMLASTSRSPPVQRTAWRQTWFFTLSFTAASMSGWLRAWVPDRREAWESRPPSTHDTKASKHIYIHKQNICMPRGHRRGT